MNKEKWYQRANFITVLLPLFGELSVFYGHISNYKNSVIISTEVFMNKLYNFLTEVVISNWVVSIDSHFVSTYLVLHEY